MRAERAISKLKAQLSAGNVDVEVAAREVATLKQELRNLAKAIASGGECNVSGGR